MKDSLENEKAPFEILQEEIDDYNKRQSDAVDFVYLGWTEKVIAADAMNRYATLKTSHLVQQLEKLQEEKDVYWGLATDYKKAMEYANKQLEEVKTESDRYKNISDSKEFELKFQRKELENASGTDKELRDAIVAIGEENTLLKSQLEEAKEHWDAADTSLAEAIRDKIRLQDEIREKDREIERLKQTISIMEDFNQENN